MEVRFELNVFDRDLAKRVPVGSDSEPGRSVNRRFLEFMGGLLLSLTGSRQNKKGQAGNSTACSRATLKKQQQEQIYGLEYRNMGPPTLSAATRSRIPKL